MHLICPSVRSLPALSRRLQARHGQAAIAWRWRYAAIALLALGMMLRAGGLLRPGLHPDEALYASWALRIADGSSPALLDVAVDKPPLMLYALAAAFRLAGFHGQTHFDPQPLVLAGRLLAWLATGTSLAALAALARRVYGARVATLALALAAVSPLAVRLSPTLFTDPWLALWLTLGLLAAVQRRAGLAGLACGLAYATKQQGVLFLPLIVAALAVAVRSDPARRRTAPAARLAWRFVQGMAAPVALALWWDSLRWQFMPSYWQRSVETYGGVAWAAQASLGPRLAQWLKLLGYGFGWPLWVLGCIAALLNRWPRRGSRQPTTRANTVIWPLAVHFDRLLALYALGYVLLHLVLQLAPWDRYALPLVPLLALPLAQALAAAWQRLGVQGRRTLAVGLTLAALVAVGMGTAGHLPLGDAGVYDDTAAAAAWMRAHAAPGAVVYHRWLGWHYGFYLYGSGVELRWWGSPADLAVNVAATRGPQWIVFPDGAQPRPAAAALAAVGLTLTPVEELPSLTVYRLERAP